jgi:hypothetical protein
MSVREPREPELPAGAAALGLAGVLPFAAGAIALALLDEPAAQAAARALVAYGAVHWGLELAAPATGAARRLAAGVLPSLAGWIALLLEPRAGLALLVVAFGAFWLYEHRVLGASRLSPAWLALRRNLTLAVCSLLALGLLAHG